MKCEVEKPWDAINWPTKERALAEAHDEGFVFQRLEVWQKAVKFAGLVYAVTRSFPRQEQFGLTLQLRRAGVSVVANIAEGAVRTSGKDRARFFEVAYGSLNEVVAILQVALGERLVTAEQMRSVQHDASVICRMLSGLRRAALAVDVPIQARAGRGRPST